MKFDCFAGIVRHFFGIDEDFGKVRVFTRKLITIIGEEMLVRIAFANGPRLDRVWSHLRKFKLVAGHSELSPRHL